MLLNAVGMGFLNKLHQYTFEIRLESHCPRRTVTHGTMIRDDRDAVRPMVRGNLDVRIAVNETLLLNNRKTIAETGKVTSRETRAGRDKLNKVQNPKI